MTPDQFLIDIMPSREQVTNFLTKAGPDGLQPNRGWLYDAELGWVHGDCEHTDPRYGVNRTVTYCSYEPFGARKVINGAGQTARIHTYGDSFTHCDQVSDGETWQEYLASHLREPIYNFGVGGYSVYQAYRRMVKVHRDTDCKASHVILNIYEDDHYRNLDAWRSIRSIGRTNCGFTLPHIDVDLQAGTYTERENTCDTPEKAYKLCDSTFVTDTFRNRPELRVAINQLNQAQQQDNRSEELTASSDLSRPEYKWVRAARQAMNAELTPAALAATRYVVEKFEQFTAAHNMKLLIVLSFGMARVRSALAGEPKFDQTLVDWLSARDTPMVDMRDKFAARHKAIGGDLDAFLAPYWIGHHSPAGNFFTAWALTDDLVAWLDPKPAPYL